MNNIKRYCSGFSLLLLFLFVVTACSKSESSVEGGGPNNSNGAGGSTARFTIAGNYMYTVDDQQLHVFDIANPLKPVEVRKFKVGVRIETIFNRNNTLFIGSQSGVYIFDLRLSPESPVLLSVYSHIVSCDPVVADSNYAYVTLRSSGRRCGSGFHQLDIVKISDLTHPAPVRSYQMLDPKGLGIDGKQLFICDNGLKVYDVSDVNNLVIKHNFPVDANDVIPNNGKLLLIGSNNFSQYTYTNDTISLLSKMNF